MNPSKRTNASPGAALVLCILAAATVAAQTVPAPLQVPSENGPHAVGYRVIDHWDRSRTRLPARTFDGRPTAGERAMPMQISVWYPAVAGGTPMTIGEYWAISAKSTTLGSITPAGIAATSARIRAAAAFPLGAEPSAAAADSIRDLRAHAVRDARPAGGRFPLLVASISPSGNRRLAEYLASHGYVVVGALPVGTAAQQVNRVQVAIETHTRTLETAQAVATTMPFVDASRTGLIGLNFDGLSALTHQMRNMNASAVVSVDGYETKTFSAAGLRASPYYDPARMRVPYLSFAQDNPPTPALAFSDSLARELKYSDRYAYVVRDMDHVALLEDLLIYPHFPAARRIGYEFVFRTMRAFLDAHVKGDTAGRSFMARSAAANGFPAGLVKTEVKLAAYPAIPTADEVEQIAMVPDVDRLRNVFREARAIDSTVRMFTAGELNLYAFRHRRTPEVSIKFNELAVEAFPGSTSAANNLGNSLRDAGQIPRAIEWWEKALTLIDADPEISPPNKAPSRTSLETKIRAAR